MSIEDPDIEVDLLDDAGRVMGRAVPDDLFHIEFPITKEGRATMIGHSGHVLYLIPERDRFFLQSGDTFSYTLVMEL